MLKTEEQRSESEPPMLPWMPQSPEGQPPGVPYLREERPSVLLKLSLLSALRRPAKMASPRAW